GMSFIVVFEKHKSGWPHMHALIRAPFMPVKWLRAAWEEITGSWNVNICSLRSHDQAAAYAAKYIGKDLHAFAHCKRWWRSHDYDHPCPDDAQRERDRRGWNRWYASLPAITSALRALGAQVERDGPERILWRSPPGAHVSAGD